MKVCMAYADGISTIRGGGIAAKIKSIVKESHDEINYSIITSIEEVDIEDIKFLEDLGVNIEGVELSRNPALNCLRFASYVTKTKFDIIHFHRLPLAWDIRLGLFLPMIRARNPRLIYEHEIATLGNLHPVHQWWYFTVFKMLYPLWDKVIVPSQYMLAEASRLVRQDLEKIELIPIGVNLEEIQNSEPMNLDGVSFLFFGHLTRLKGVDILIRAFHKISQRNREVQLHLIGDGKLRGFCENFVHEKNLEDRVHFWGACRQNLLFRILKGADICIFPSRNEASGLAVYEAMAAGKPIISTRVGGIPELMTDGRNGILVKPDVDQLVYAMQHLLDNVDVREIFSRNNFRDVAKHSWKDVAKKYVRIYQSLVHKE